MRALGKSGGRALSDRDSVRRYRSNLQGEVDSATLFTGRGALFSGARQLLIGLAAAALTFGLGKLLGPALAG